MNDEFSINKIISIGSEGSSQTLFWLYFENHGMAIEEMSRDVIIRLHAFLTAYINKEGGNNEP